ncbi:MAG TPA: hypothetical protein VMV77_15070 [Bacteroidales bacterium]|nr:hypothetical protein [Bacteroidales bacterium]
MGKSVEKAMHAGAKADLLKLMGKYIPIKKLMSMMRDVLLSLKKLESELFDSRMNKFLIIKILLSNK